MSEVLTQVAQTSATARRSAVEAASAAGCTIRPISRLSDLLDASAIFNRVWGRSADQALVPLEMLRALTHAGNYAAGAFVGGSMVGAILGFLGQHEDELHLHSHIMGFLPDVRGRGMGFALKLDQRAWALDRGIRRVTWTFDPLVRANAYFNLTKLGARASAYYADFYGLMDDDINGDDQTDRLLVTWDLSSRSVADACDGDALTSAHFADVDAYGPVLQVDGEGGPAVVVDGDGPRIKCRIPADIVSLRQEKPGAANRWRRALRETLGSALEAGYEVVGVTRTGWYLLESSTLP